MWIWFIPKHQRCFAAVGSNCAVILYLVSDFSFLTVETMVIDSIDRAAIVLGPSDVADGKIMLTTSS